LVVEARLYEKLRDAIIRCKVCPRRCYIADGKRGFCGVRENKNSVLYALTYGKLTALNADPIEKKPFFNFWPGSYAFSISSVGCSFTCPWCQNWSISQAKPEEVSMEEVPPESIVKFAKSYGCKSIAYTYNEPIIWFEYVLDTSIIAKREGLLNVLVTNGYVTEEAIDEFSPYIDAANVDIKAFNPEFYQKYCKAKMDDVLTATEKMVEKGWHVETTYLIIPNLNDNLEEIRRMVRWVRDKLGADTPIHFSRFFPMYKMTKLPPTPLNLIIKAREIALEEGLHYVYTGNVAGHEGENTYCPACGKLLVRRIGFEVLEWNLKEDMCCPKCGEKIAIKGKFERIRKSRIFW